MSARPPAYWGRAGFGSSVGACVAFAALVGVAGLAVDVSLVLVTGRSTLRPKAASLLAAGLAGGGTTRSALMLCGACCVREEEKRRVAQLRWAAVLTAGLTLVRGVIMVAVCGPYLTELEVPARLWCLAAMAALHVWGLGVCSWDLCVLLSLRKIVAAGGTGWEGKAPMELLRPWSGGYESLVAG